MPTTKMSEDTRQLALAIFNKKATSSAGPMTFPKQQIELIGSAVVEEVSDSCSRVRAAPERKLLSPEQAVTEAPRPRALPSVRTVPALPTRSAPSPQLSAPTPSLRPSLVRVIADVAMHCLTIIMCVLATSLVVALASGAASSGDLPIMGVSGRGATTRTEPPRQGALPGAPAATTVVERKDSQ